jgi:tetratricopeptide (TPR) repeat protein
MSNIEQLVLQAKTCFQIKDYETCMSLTDEALRADPGNTEASWLMKEAQRQWEDQRSLEQLEIYVENLKKEAMDLFDKERYEQCLGMFRFLSELEPENHTLRDYVRLSQQMFVETIGAVEPTSEAGTSNAAAGEKQSEVPALSFRHLETQRPADLPPAPVPWGQRKPSAPDSTSTIPEPGATKVHVLEAGAVPQSVKRKIIQEYFTATMPARRRRLWNIGLSSALLLLTTLGAASFWIYTSLLVSHVEIQSTPEKAVVFIDNKRAGETPWRQGIATGSHALRIEKKGYQPYVRTLAVGRAQAVILEVQLESSAKTATTSNVQPTVPLESPTQPLASPAVSEPVESTIHTAQIAQSVIHHHLLGSCTGRLKIDGEKISFWSSGTPRDSFTRKIKQINNFSLDDKLLIEFKDKVYRFEALARDAKDNRERLTPFYEQIKLQRTPQQKSP